MTVEPITTVLLLVSVYTTDHNRSLSMAVNNVYSVVY